MRIYILCFIFLFTACSNPYHEHFFRENPEFGVGLQHVSGEVFLSDGRIDSLPNSSTQNNLIQSLDMAQSRIWIEMYTWTDAAKLIDPIIRAKKRGVDVQVVLEGNVFGTPKINFPIAKKLLNVGIPIAYADNHRYSFTHAKFWIIDDTYSISTGNWTASFFTKNREYIYTATDHATLSFLENIFQADLHHMSYKDISSIPMHIVISPLDARYKLESLIVSTKKDLTLYVQTIDDDHILGLLHEMITSGKNIYICTADNASNQARQLQFPSGHWKLIRKPYLHAKVIIVDHTRVFIGSHNLTTNAIENNREMGMILNHRSDIVDRIESDFVHDGCI